MRNPIIALLVTPVLLASSCSRNGSTTPVPTPPVDTSETYVSKPSVNGVRIAWDYSSLRRVAPLSPGTRNYCGYARLIQLRDGSLFCVYEADGNIEALRSTDAGNTWGNVVTIAAKETGINMAVPEVLQLADNSLLVSYNPRPPQNNSDITKKFGIRTKRSTDNGNTWASERQVYTADYRFNNGCWEPAQIQLPSGEIQLFFANEAVYPSSNEQNISLMRSTDGGLTWVGPDIVSYRAGKRDGMPVPLLLANNRDIVFSIEDNNVTTFKPYTIRSSVAANWNNGTVVGNSPNRLYALAEPLADAVYAGAPYLRQLKAGPTLLSYQSTEGRSGNDISVSRMVVAIGDEEAKGFNRTSEPFAIGGSKSGLWNSLSVLNDNTVIALTSTSHYSNAGTEVWMIKGHVIPEPELSSAAVMVDGVLNEAVWAGSLPVFVGQKGAAGARIGFACNNDFLFMAATVSDANVITDSPSPADDDAVVLMVDAKNKSSEGLTRNQYRIIVAADGKLDVKEGSKGTWVNANGNSIQKAAVKITGGYRIELAVPWTVLGGKPAVNTRIGFTAGLVNDNDGGSADYSEVIPATTEGKPFTWIGMRLK